MRFKIQHIDSIRDCGGFETYPWVILRKISFASCCCLLVTGFPGAGVWVATRGRPSEVRATCVRRGGIVMVLLFRFTGETCR
jgi:hypothetical protein